MAKLTLDDGKREKMLSELSDIVTNDVALIPTRGPHRGPERTFQFTTRADQYTLAMNAKTV